MGQSTPPLEVCGSAAILAYPGERTVLVDVPVKYDGRVAGYVTLAPRIPVDVEGQQRAIENYTRSYHQLAANRRNFRTFYLLIMALITLFVLFVATWIALFLAKQISVPISALLHAAGEVRKGNLRHRVEVRAMDELAGLVRAFNAMTRDLESNSRELDAAAPVHRGHSGEHPHGRDFGGCRRLHPARQPGAAEDLSGGCGRCGRRGSRTCSRGRIRPRCAT